MMKLKEMARYVTAWSVLGAIAVLVVLLAILGLVLRNMAPGSSSSPEPTAVVNIIPAPTATQFIVITATSVLPTPTVKSEFSTPQSNDQIKVGDYVQITGTGGVGLRIRSGPGIQNPPLFLGMDAEAFQVVDGPKEVDGIVWWNLVAPYDQNRKGWAASNYLTVLAKKP
jgi:hypothetical protein